MAGSWEEVLSERQRELQELGSDDAGEAQRKFLGVEIAYIEERMAARAAQLKGTHAGDTHLVLEHYTTRPHDYIPKKFQKLRQPGAVATAPNSSTKTTATRPAQPSPKLPDQYTEVATGIHWQQAVVRGIPVRIGKNDEGQIVDVQAKLSDKQYQDMISHFDNQNRDHTTSCCTYIFQSELAAFEKACLKDPSLAADGIGAFAKDLRKWSSFYAKFEGMINNALSLTDPMGELVDGLEQLLKEIKDSNMPDQMKKALLKDAQEFMKLAEELRHKSPTPAQIREFFTVQPEKNSAPCIGKFLGRQLWTLSAESRAEMKKKQDRTVTGGRLGNMAKRAFNPHPLYLHLSDAKSGIERKALSLNGVAANNSRDPVDAGMVASLSEEDNPRDDNPIYTSVMDYIDVTGDPADTDVLFKRLDPNTRDKKEEEPPPTILATAGLIGVNFIEFGLTVARVAVDNVVVGTLYGIARLPGLILALVPERRVAGQKTLGERYAAWVNKGFKKVEDGIAGAHQRASSAIGVAKLQEMRYQKYSGDLPKLHQTRSGYGDFATAFSGKNVGGFLSNVVGGILSTVVVTPLNIIRNLPNTYRKTFNPEAYHKEKVKDFKTRAKLAYQESMKNKAKVEKAGGPQEQVRRGVRPWARNEYSSPLEFFNEIFVGLADVILSPMFRHAPGFAVIFFLFSHASFGVMACPGIMAGTGIGAQHGLVVLSKLIAKDFMGKTVGSAPDASMASDALTAFLEFKLPLLTTEVVKALITGDHAYLQSLLAHPEKATGALVAFTAFMGATAALSFLPQLTLPTTLPKDMLKITLPNEVPVMGGVSLSNPIGEVLNLFVEEASEVQAKGLFPLTSIEFGFLALKLGLLAKSMVSASEDPAKEKELKLAISILEPALDEKGNRKVFQSGEQKTGQQLLMSDMMDKLVQYNKDREPEPAVGLKDLSSAELRKLIIEPALEKNGLAPGRVRDEIVNVIEKDLVWACEQTKNVNTATSKAVDAVKKLADQDETAPQLPVSKRQHLMDTIRYVQMWEMRVKNADPSEEDMDLDTANALYDELYYAFKSYNDEQRKLGNWDRMIDKNEFLHAFNNKYIEPHEKSIAIVSAIRAPFALLTGQRIKSPNDSPHRRNRVKKRAATEKAWLMEPFAMIFRANVNYARGWSLVGTVVLSPVALGAAVVSNVGLGVMGMLHTGYRALFHRDGKKTWQRWKDRMSNANDSIENAITFDPEKINAPGWMMASYGKNVRIAGTSSEHLDSSAENIINQLEAHEGEERAAINANPDRPHGEGGSKWLLGYKRQYDKKTFLSRKSNRRNEKELLTRYQSGMTDLDNRCQNLRMRIARLDPTGKNPEFQQARNELNEVIEWLDHIIDEPPKDLARMEARLKGYSLQLDVLSIIDADLKIMEEQKVAELTKAKPPAIPPKPSSIQTNQTQQATKAVIILDHHGSHGHANEQTEQLIRGMTSKTDGKHYTSLGVSAATQLQHEQQPETLLLIPNIKTGHCTIVQSKQYFKDEMELVANINNQKIQVCIDNKMVEIHAHMSPKHKGVMLMKTSFSQTGTIRHEPITDEDLKKFKPRRGGTNLSTDVVKGLADKMELKVMDANAQRNVSTISSARKN